MGKGYLFRMGILSLTIIGIAGYGMRASYAKNEPILETVTSSKEVLNPVIDDIKQEPTVTATIENKQQAVETKKVEVKKQESIKQRVAQPIVKQTTKPVVKVGTIPTKSATTEMKKEKTYPRTTTSIKGFMQIEIPKINLLCGIQRGDGDYQDVMRKSVAFGEMSLLPYVSNSNVVLFAHNTSYFKYIKDLSAGDIILLHYDGDTYKYKVTKSFYISETDVSVCDEVDSRIITLVTCVTGKDTKRLVVRGEFGEIK